jgi:polyisoprenoid-binding protein YceI
MKFNVIFTGLLLICLSVCAQQKLVPVDAGSKVKFVIKNFAINTNGQVSGLKGQIIFDKNKPANSSFDVSADVSTINTDNTKRDNHLRSEDFFDVAHYPTMRITGKPVLVKGNEYILKGNLTIKNITKPIEIPFTAVPQATGFIFEGAFRINRLDYTVGRESATMADELNISLQVLAQ